MLKMIFIIGGALLIVAAIISLFISVKRTPSSLRGYYGFWYIIISILATIGGAALITTGILFF